MSDIAIRVEGLSKLYRIGDKQQQYTSLRDLVAGQARRITRRLPRDAEEREFWALKDVSFEVKRGEIVGVIGRNGAGKSTLLKILSRITEPTEGSVELHGRVGSLLEVGTGFHPELTGRENIFLNGAILGMKRVEIQRRFDEIVAFSEIERFLDTPVKHYSSGMYVRLAFSVAAHLETDILLVDEVLAVGDAQFQQKCLGKMDAVSKLGRTVLFISHNMGAIGRLCQQAIGLDAGVLGYGGSVEGAMAWYNYETKSGNTGTSRDQSIGDGEAKYVSWEFVNSSTGARHACYSRDECSLRFRLDLARPVRRARLGIDVEDMSGQRLISAHSMDAGGSEINLARGVYHVTWTMPIPLIEGEYFVIAGLGAQVEGQIDLWRAAPNLAVIPKVDSHLPRQLRGMVSVDARLKICPIEPSGNQS